MTSSAKKVIQKTLKHYDEMIEWAKGQKARAYPDEWKMYKEIRQNWFDSYCPLCKKFFSSVPLSCGECPLYLRYGRCGVSIKNKWEEMNEAATWKTWIRHATAMREQIASLLEEG